MVPPAAAQIVQHFTAPPTQPVSGRAVLASLTPREHHVFTLASRGLKYSEIAVELEISEKTVKTHLQNIYKKLNLWNKAEIAHPFKDQPTKANDSFE